MGALQKSQLIKDLETLRSLGALQQHELEKYLPYLQDAGPKISITGADTKASTGQTEGNTDLPKQATSFVSNWADDVEDGSGSRRQSFVGEGGREKKHSRIVYRRAITSPVIQDSPKRWVPPSYHSDICFDMGRNITDLFSSSTPQFAPPPEPVAPVCKTTNVPTDMRVPLAKIPEVGDTVYRDCTDWGLQGCLNGPVVRQYPRGGQRGEDLVEVTFPSPFRDVTIPVKDLFKMKEVPAPAPPQPVPAPPQPVPIPIPQYTPQYVYPSPAPPPPQPSTAYPHYCAYHSPPAPTPYYPPTNYAPPPQPSYYPYPATSYPHPTHTTHVHPQQSLPSYPYIPTQPGGNGYSTA